MLNSASNASKTEVSANRAEQDGLAGINVPRSQIISIQRDKGQKQNKRSPLPHQRQDRGDHSHATSFLVLEERQNGSIVELPHLAHDHKQINERENAAQSAREELQDGHSRILDIESMNAHEAAE